jgi:L-asparaginase / beta-aspartyl-peptidase
VQLLANGEGESGVVAAVAALLAGRSAIDAVETGICLVEDDPAVHSVGRGGIPNLRGIVECDASIMEGRTRMCGAVAGLQGVLHAISVARAVMERLPHAFLAGEGARALAREIGVPLGELLTPEARATYERRIHDHAPEVHASQSTPDCIGAAWASARHTACKGTTVYLARDRDGRMAGGASSSGWPLKYPGRVGDSAVIGAGLYVDERYGGCACTHTGEMTIRCHTASRVVHQMRAGAGVEEACRDAIRDLHGLEEGLLGPVAIHAMDPQGRACVLSTMPLPSDAAAWFWDPVAGDPVRIEARFFGPGR